MGTCRIPNPSTRVVKSWPVDAVTISYQVARHGVVRKRFYNLLCRPSSGRVFRDVEMQNTSTIMREDDENIKHAELDGRDCEEVDRDHLPDVISKKRHPGLRRLSRLLRHQPRHSPFRNLKSKFFQFTVYPRCSPCRISSCH